MMENTENQYSFICNMMQLYKRLQDEQSKELFWARLQFDMEPNMDTAVRFNEIVRQYQEPSAQTYKNAWREEFAKSRSQGKKIILYGAGVIGKTYATYILNSHEDFYAFCDQNKSGETILGKPVLSPTKIIANPMAYAVLISATKYYTEMLSFLEKNKFPMDSILHCFDFANEEPYFVFPELFKQGTAFVDAGCYDGKDTVRFSKWCGGGYSKIFAFEPDETNYKRCRENIDSAGISNVALFQAGLSDISGQAEFATAACAGSYLVSTDQVAFNVARPEADNVTIRTIMLDELVDVEVGMIKMDIEGAEFDALHGSKQIIQRDKPLLAICVYHRQGDMLAIMDYLHSFVPEYRFWLRHHAILAGDTVLYAAV